MYVQVAGAEGGDGVELPLEEDKTMLLSTLASHFPGACGLKYKSAVGTTRGIRMDRGRFFPPTPDGWGNTMYYCVFKNVSDSLSQFTTSEANLSTVSGVSSQSIVKKYRLRSQLNEQSTSIQSDKIRFKQEPNSSNNVDFFSSCNSSKSIAPRSDADYNSKMEEISTTVAELKKAYKQKLIYALVMNSYKDLIFNKSHTVPKQILQHCQSNILKAKIAFFRHPNKMCNKELYQAIFSAPLPSDPEPLNVKDAQVLENKLLEHATEKSLEILDSISEIEQYDLAVLLKPKPMKPKSIVTDELLYIISKSREIKNLHDKCKGAAKEMLDLLEQLGDDRRTIFPRLNKKTVDHLKIEAELAEKKTRCFSHEILTKIKEGDPSVNEALQTLINNSKESVDKKEYELAKLKDLRAAYDKVKGEKFSELVSTYKSLVQKTDRLSTLCKSMNPCSYANDDSYQNYSYIDSDDD